MSAPSREAHVEGLPMAGAPAEAAAQLAVPAPPELALAVEVSGLTSAQVRVLRASFGKLSLEQLQMFLAICARKGVDPFTQAYAFPNNDGGLAFGLKIDGMRALARRAARYSRVIELLTVPEHPEEILGARCTIQRDGDPAPFVSEVLLREYHKGGNWNVMPEVMIKKVAEATCLRGAFADALSGVYEPAEIEP
jgi:hypothetical protein